MLDAGCTCGKWLSMMLLEQKNNACWMQDALAESGF
jgi:hypothetical protein